MQNRFKNSQNRFKSIRKTTKRTEDWQGVNEVLTPAFMIRKIGVLMLIALLISTLMLTACSNNTGNSSGEGGPSASGEIIAQSEQLDQSESAEQAEETKQPTVVDMKNEADESNEGEVGSGNAGEKSRSEKIKKKPRPTAPRAKTVPNGSMLGYMQRLYRKYGCTGEDDSNFFRVLQKTSDVFGISIAQAKVVWDGNN